MRALIQRVSEARVVVNEEIVGEIGRGLLVFLGVHLDDTEAEVKWLANKVLQLRVFPDKEDKMNLSVTDVKGSLLVVSQFTLYGETSKGNRPSYSKAARPEKALPLYNSFVTMCEGRGVNVATGKFQAHMDVHLVNDGPVTLFCETES